MNGLKRTAVKICKKERTIFIKLLSFLLLCLCFSFNTFSQTTNKDSKIISVGIYHNPPLEDYVDGKAIGLYPALLDEIAHKNNWRLQYVFGTWQDIYNLLLEGKIDLLPNIVYLPERDSLVDFNKETVLTMWAELYTLPNFSFENFYQLKNTKIGVLKGGAHGIKFKTMMSDFKINVSYIAFEDYESIAKAIDQKEIIGGIFNNFVGHKLSNNYKIAKSKIFLSPNRLLFATKKGLHKDLITAIDNQMFVWEKNKDSFYYNAINTWITQYAQSNLNYKYFKWFIFLVLGLFIIGFLWVYTLRRKIAKEILKYKKSAQKLISKEEEKFKIETILNHTEDDIWSLDRNFKLIAFNQSFKKSVLNLDNNNLKIGDSIFDKYSKENKNYWEPKYKKVLNGEKLTFEYINKNDKYSKYFEIKLNPIIIKETIVGLSAIGRDITERKKSEENLFDLLELAPMAFFQGDVNGNFIKVNNKAVDLTGYSSKELLTMNMKDLFYEVYLKEKPLSYDKLKTGEIVKNERKLKSKKEQNIHIEMLSKSMSDNTYQCFMTDITDRKQTEKALVDLNKNLENIIADRTKSLTEANKELEAFSYSVSHDLRAPLTRISGFSNAINMLYRDKLDDKGQHYLNRIEAAGKDMSILIDDLLSLSKITRFDVVKAKFNISDLVVQKLEEIKINYPNLLIKSKIKSDVFINADRRLVIILIDNLLSNAVKFSSKNNEAIIEFGKKAIDNKSYLYIKDNGAGFDMKYYDDLFVPFKRLHSGLDYKGTGIGLTIVKRIINKHNGTINIESIIDKDTTVSFYL